MNEDLPSPSEHRGWLERLGKSLISEPADRDQLIEVLRNAERRNLVDADVLSMIEGALQVTEMKVRDIMIPRVQMVTLEDSATLEEMLDKIVESGHSRFPIVSSRKDSITGLILAKDLLRYLKPGASTNFDLKDVLRPVVFIPESKRLNVLLREFRHRRNHMAIVVDEYGAASGLITIEDVLEQIVGDIDDEYDVDEVDNAVLEQEENRYTVKALMPLDEFNEYFNTSFDEDAFDTVGGLVVKQFGYLPKIDETVNIDGFNFRVMKADGRRLHLLELTIDGALQAVG
ncbi:MAG: HlyC/CorC family transporter [Thiotrichales bacterium]